MLPTLRNKTQRHNIKCAISTVYPSNEAQKQPSPSSAAPPVRTQFPICLLTVPLVALCGSKFSGSVWSKRNIFVVFRAPRSARSILPNRKLLRKIKVEGNTIHYSALLLRRSRRRSRGRRVLFSTSRENIKLNAMIITIMKPLYGLQQLTQQFPFAVRYETADIATRLVLQLQIKL